MSDPFAFAVLSAMLFIKHFAADGPLQTANQVRNKGKFLHPAGLQHAGLHAVLTALCLLVWGQCFKGAVELGVGLIALVSSLEFVVHYTIDFMKSNFESTRDDARRVPDEDGGDNLLIVSDTFFTTVLADQLLHSLTYVVIVFTIAGL